MYILDSKTYLDEAQTILNTLLLGKKITVVNNVCFSEIKKIDIDGHDSGDFYIIYFALKNSGCATVTLDLNSQRLTAFTDSSDITSLTITVEDIPLQGNGD